MPYDILYHNELDIKSVERTFSKTLKQLQNGDSWTGEFSVRARNDASFMVHVRDVPVRASNGELIGMIGISRRS